MRSCSVGADSCSLLWHRASLPDRVQTNSGKSDRAPILRKAQTLSEKKELDQHVAWPQDDADVGKTKARFLPNSQSESLSPGKGLNTSLSFR